MRHSDKQRSGQSTLKMDANAKSQPQAPISDLQISPVIFSGCISPHLYIGSDSFKWESGAQREKVHYNIAIA